MDSTTQRLMMGAAGVGGDKLYVEDVFSTWLYTGTGSTQTITNGIDLAGKGGLIWIRDRVTNGSNHYLVSSADSFSKSLFSNWADGSSSYTPISSVSSTGYTDAGGWSTSQRMVSWTFRKAAKFFDVVTYTGNGSNRTIAHNLGSVPGCIIVKRTDTSGNWQVYHRSLANTEYLVLNGLAGKATDATLWNSTTPTSTAFSLGTDATVNASNGTYVAYLFAHDAGGFGDSSNDNVISCGSYTGNGSTTGTTVTLGWEPQWLLIKRTDSISEWNLLDTMRGFVVGGTDAELNPNNQSVESSGTFVSPLSTGFQLTSTDLSYNASGNTYIYIAIRRGPMKTPTDATKVFVTATQGSAGDNLAPGYRSTFPVDFAFWSDMSSTSNRRVMSRMQGINGMYSDLTNAEASFGSSYTWDYQNGFLNNTGTVATNRAWMFRRAPGFFDVVAGTTINSNNQRFSHNLGIPPELVIAKTRAVADNWYIYAASQGRNKYHYFDNQSIYTFADFWGTSNPSATDFGLASNQVFSTGTTLIAYLFASCPGVSKVGYYTGTGTTLSIDCGFTNGARFVLIKRTDSTGDWYVWDTARGIVSGNDPYLLLNSTAAEVTNTDYIDPLSSGFQISSTAPAAINASGGSFIYLAIA